MEKADGYIIGMISRSCRGHLAWMLWKPRVLKPHENYLYTYLSRFAVSEYFANRRYTRAFERT